MKQTSNDQQDVQETEVYVQEKNKKKKKIKDQEITHDQAAIKNLDQEDVMEQTQLDDIIKPRKKKKKKRDKSLAEQQEEPSIDIQIESHQVEIPQEIQQKKKRKSKRHNPHEEITPRPISEDQVHSNARQEEGYNTRSAGFLITEIQIDDPYQQVQTGMKDGGTKSSNFSQIMIPNVEKSLSTQSAFQSDERIKVFIRIRPQMRNEIGKEVVTFTDKNNPQILKVSNHQHYLESQFNQVFDQKSSQREIFQNIQYCLDSVINGFNSTIFAYGQTGSGKTYSIFGEGFQKGVLESVMQREQMKYQGAISINNLQQESETLKVLKKSKLGIIPRSVSHVFQEIERLGLKCTVYLSFLQIYNEQIYDMLGLHPGQKRAQEKGLRIREDKTQGIYVEGLTEYIVTNKDQCLELLVKGEKIRAKRTTRLNMQSSRSHSIFQLLIESDEADEKGMMKRAKLNIGDLAGSEKIYLDEFPSAQHLNELKNINLSLTNLGKVISKLATKTQVQHIPFRDSKLTRLLQDSLGGNTRTCLIATVSPTIEYIDETLSTLKFANRTKFVTTKVSKNEINAQDDALVMKLQKEIQYLKDLLQMRRKGDKNSLQEQLFRLREENDRLRQIALSIADVEKLKQDNKLMRLEMQKYINNSGEEEESDQEHENQRNKQEAYGNLRRASTQISKDTASDTIKYVKRTIQDTGATEDSEMRESVSQVNKAALRIVDDEEILIGQQHKTSRVQNAPRKVIEELLKKQKKLRNQINGIDRQTNDRQFEENKSQKSGGSSSLIRIRRNSMINQSEEDEADFNTYKHELEGTNSNVLKQSLNHSRNLAGIGVHRSAALDKNRQQKSTLLTMNQKIPQQASTISLNQRNHVYQNVKTLLQNAPQPRIIGLSQQSVEAYNLPTINQAQSASRNTQNRLAKQTPAKTTFKSNRVLPQNNDPYSQALDITPKVSKTEVKRTLRYRAGNEDLRSNVKTKQTSLFQGHVSDFNVRRKSNGDTTQRTRNYALVESVSTLHLARKSLPRLGNNQIRQDQVTASEDAFSQNTVEKKLPSSVKPNPTARKLNLPVGGNHNDEEKKNKNDQELFYKRATERLMQLEQMEQDRKRKFELELLKLHKDNLYINNQQSSHREPQQMIRRIQQQQKQGGGGQSINIWKQR